MIGQADSS